MNLLRGRKSDGHLCQEHEKILKDICLQRMEGHIGSIKEDKGYKKRYRTHKWIRN